MTAGQAQARRLRQRRDSQDCIAVGLHVDEHLCVRGVQAHVLQAHEGGSVDVRARDRLQAQDKAAAPPSAERSACCALLPWKQCMVLPGVCHTGQAERAGRSTWGRIWPWSMVPSPTRGRVKSTVSDWSPLANESMMAMKPPPAPWTTVRQGGVTFGLSCRAVVEDAKTAEPNESYVTRLQSWPGNPPPWQSVSGGCQPVWHCQ